MPDVWKKLSVQFQPKEILLGRMPKKAQKMRIDEVVPVRPRKKRAKTMTEIAKAARGENMSYGNYVLKYGI